MKHFARLAGAALIGAVTLAGAVPAQAQETIRFAFIKATTLIPFFYANEKGYFAEQGLTVEMIPVQGGPAVAAAIGGGSADIGYAAITPVAIAREQGQPYRFFIGLEQEQLPDLLWGKMIASEQSGVKTLADLKGKNVLVGAPGGLCELAAREWVAKAGLQWSDVNPLFVPPPQMQAALEVGNADAACIFEPFFTAAMNSAAKPVVLASGYLADEKRPYNVDGIFADENWIKANGDKIAKFKVAVQKAWKELANDRDLLVGILDKEFRFPPELFDQVRLDYDADVGIDPAMLEPIIEALKKHGMLTTDMKVGDIVWSE